MSAPKWKAVPGLQVIDDSGDYTEAIAAEVALGKMPPIKAVGSDWYAYSNGVWAPTSFHPFRPVVLGVLGGKLQTARRTGEILRHIESAKQVNEAELRGFHFQDGERVLINARNGVIEVQPGDGMALLEHSPEYRFTRQLAAAYDDGAKCTRFLGVLKEALPDAQDRRLLRLFAGSLLLPSCRYQAALVCYGPGGTGKSTLGDAIAGSLGGALVEHVGLANLCDPRGFHLVKLRHCAVNIATELDALEIGESGHFKALVSGEPIATRAIYDHPVTLQTSAKLLFLGNSLPRFKNGTDAELRRCRFLRFDQVPTKLDPELKAKLASERDGILSWMLRGLVTLLAESEMPYGGELSQETRERFAISNDPLGTFIARRCVLDPSEYTEKPDFEGALKDWCEKHAIPAEDPRWLFRQLWDRWPGLREAQRRMGRTRVRVIAGLVLR